MQGIYSRLQSSSFFVECFRETMPLLIAAVLLYLYYKRRISIIDTLLYAFASEAYTILAIGPTFTATFFISTFIFMEQAHRLFTGGQHIRREYLLLLLLPLLSHITVFLITQLYKDPFNYPGGRYYAFYTKPVYFYIKTYLPLFAIGGRIVQERNALSWDAFCETMKRITKISLCIAGIQIFIQLTFQNVALSEILGLQSRYLAEQISGPLGLRVQAWFGEPKVFSAFLSLAIPILLKDKEYKIAGAAFVVGILTASQTFYINLVVAGVVFIIFGRLNGVRLKILCTLGLIIGIFMTVAASKDYLLKHYMANRNDPVYKALFERSAYRYDNEIWQKNNIILGMPLQRDMELPVVDFLRDEPYLLISGYGAGNSTFIPPSYFFGQPLYEFRVAGVGGHNLNMRWFFILAEFGGVALIFFFLLLTRVGSGVLLFQRSYFAFVAVCFFFSQIDLIMIIVAMLGAYGTAPAQDPLYEKDIRLAWGR